jgi:hypothetical protein
MGFSCLLVLLIASTAAAETVAFKILNSGVLEERLRLAHKDPPCVSTA